MLFNRFLIRPAGRLRLFYEPLRFTQPQIQFFKSQPYVCSEKKDDACSAYTTSNIKIDSSYLAKSTGKETLSASTKPPEPPAEKKPPPKRKDFIQRATYSGKCRWGFIPEEFFHFFYPLTGVSGGYFFILGVVNFMLSKEIYVLEHEYYTGLSVFVVMLYVVKAFGKTVGKSLDKQVDAVVDSLNKERQAEIKNHQDFINGCADLQLRAKSQKLLMDGKKENIAMQLEAAYRERAMLLYRRVKGRLDYHVMRHRTETRIEQKWMLEWILDQVRKSITPEFERKALAAAIDDLASAADRFKKSK